MLIEAAADGLLKQVWQLLPATDELGERFAAVPWGIPSLDGYGRGSASPRLEVHIRHPTEQQLRCQFSAHAEARLLAACGEWRQARILEPEGRGPVKELLEQFNKGCYEGLGTYKGKPYWLVTPLQDHGQGGVLAVASFDRGRLEALEEPVRAKATDIVTYGERCRLAALLTRACGTPKGEGVCATDRQAAFSSVRSHLKRLSERSDRTIPLEWRPFLTDLDYALSRIGDPSVLTDVERSVFDEHVVSALGSALYYPVSELRASYLLRSITGLPMSEASKEPILSEEVLPEWESITDPEERLRLIDEGLRWLDEHGGHLGD
jgi:hypothetical protein